MLGTRGVPARYGGFETAVEEIGRRLVEADHDVTVYCRNPDQSLRSHHGMTLVNLPAIRREAVETLSHTGLSTLHAVTRAKPDVAFLFNAANAPFIPLLRSAGVPTAIHVDGLEWRRAKWGKRAASYYRWAEERSTRWAQAVIADSIGIAEHLHSHHGITAEYIPYGASAVAAPVERVAELGLTRHGYHLVVARLEPENHVAEIVAGYVSSACNLPLIVVGDAVYRDSYRRRVHRTAGDDARVRFTGSIWDQCLLDALYAGAASYIHGHSVGGTNPSLLRAMGAGAPIIANDVSFNREVARHHGTYFRTPDDISRACEQVERDLPSALARGRAGRADVLARYDWDDVASKYEKLAHRLIIDKGLTDHGVMRTRLKPRAAGIP